MKKKLFILMSILAFSSLSYADLSIEMTGVTSVELVERPEISWSAATPYSISAKKFSIYARDKKMLKSYSERQIKLEGLTDQMCSQMLLASISKKSILKIGITRFEEKNGEIILDRGTSSSCGLKLID